MTKKNRIGLTVWGIIAGLGLAAGAFYVGRSTQGDRTMTQVRKDDTGMTLAPKVSMEMMSAEHWLNQVDRPDEIIMSADEITAFNQRLEQGALATVFCSIREEKRTSLTKEEVLSQIGEPTIPKDDCYVNEKKLDTKYWNTLFQNLNLSYIEETITPRFGFTVKRASIRKYPTEDVVVTDPTDKLSDELQNSSTLINEPAILLHQSEDQNWGFILTDFYAGWVSMDSIALCDSIDTWLTLQNPEDFLIVTENSFSLEEYPDISAISNLQVSMGTKLALEMDALKRKTVDGRTPYDCYAVQIPVRDSEGNLQFETGFIPYSRKVSIGYVDYTTTQLLSLAYESLGTRYGWGGMFQTRDCSQYVMEIYRCFGIHIPRDTKDQAKMPCQTVDLKDLEDSEKEKLLDQIPVGAELYFPGHVMIYLGKDGDNYYVISALGGMQPEDQAEVLPINTVTVNTLQVVRRNGKSWLNSLEEIIVIR